MWKNVIQEVGDTRVDFIIVIDKREYANNVFDVSKMTGASWAGLLSCWLTPASISWSAAACGIGLLYAVSIMMAFG